MKRFIALLLALLIAVPNSLFAVFAATDDVTLQIVPGETTVQSDGVNPTVISYTVTAAVAPGKHVGSFMYYLAPSNSKATLTKTKVNMAQLMYNEDLGFTDGPFEFVKYDKPSKLFVAAGTLPDRTMDVTTKIMDVVLQLPADFSGEFTLDVLRGDKLSAGEWDGETPLTIGVETTTVTVQAPTPTEVELPAALTVTGIDAPVTGAAPDTEAVAPENTTVSQVRWLSGSETLSGSFAAGTAYTVELTLNANSGYKFAEATTVTVNGQPASVSKSGSDLVVSYTFPATEVPLTELPDSLAFVGINDPVTGAVPRTDIAAPLNITVSQVRWLDGSEALSGNFAAETAYTLELTLKANDGYKFAESTTITINRKPASVSKSGSDLVVTYTFPATEALIDVLPGTLAVTGIDAPVRGAAPDTEAVAPAHTSISKLEWLAGSETLSGNFAGGTAYTVRVTLGVNEGHAFAEPTAITINGETASVSKSGSDLVASYTFPATESAPKVELPSPLIVEGISRPMAGQPLDTTATAPENTTLTKLEWLKGGVVVTGDAAENATYTVRVTLTANEGCFFATPTWAVLYGEWVDSNITGNTLVAEYEFTPTGTTKPLHNITVVNGYAYLGAGNRITKAPEGTVVTLSTGATPEGKRFNKWVSEDATTEAPDSEGCYFTMPDHDVTWTATYNTVINKVIFPTSMGEVVAGQTAAPSEVITKPEGTYQLTQWLDSDDKPFTGVFQYETQYAFVCTFTAADGYILAADAQATNDYRPESGLDPTSIDPDHKIMTMTWLAGKAHRTPISKVLFDVVTPIPGLTAIASEVMTKPEGTYQLTGWTDNSNTPFTGVFDYATQYYALFTFKAAEGYYLTDDVQTAPSSSPEANHNPLTHNKTQLTQKYLVTTPPELSITWDSDKVDFVYGDDTAQTATANTAGTMSYSYESVPAGSYGPSATAPTLPGKYKVTATLTNDSTAVLTASREFTVKKAPLKLTFNKADVNLYSKWYDGTTEYRAGNITLQSEGLLPADSDFVFVLYRNDLSYAFPNVVEDNALVYTKITAERTGLTTAEAGSYIDARYDVTPPDLSSPNFIDCRPLKLKVVDPGKLTKVYDGTTAYTGAPLQIAIKNVIGEEPIITVDNSDVKYNSPDVATADRVQIKSYPTAKLDELCDTGNYTLYLSGKILAEPAASITPRPLSGVIKGTEGPVRVGEEFSHTANADPFNDVEPKATVLYNGGEKPTKPGVYDLTFTVDDPNFTVDTERIEGITKFEIKAKAHKPGKPDKPEPAPEVVVAPQAAASAAASPSTGDPSQLMLLFTALGASVAGLGVAGKHRKHKDQ